MDTDNLNKQITIAVIKTANAAINAHHKYKVQLPDSNELSSIILDAAVRLFIYESETIPNAWYMLEHALIRSLAGVRNTPNITKELERLNDMFLSGISDMRTIRAGDEYYLEFYDQACDRYISLASGE